MKSSITKSKLSAGSTVFYVNISDCDSECELIFSAIDEEAANSFVRGLDLLIENYTVDTLDD